MALSKSSSYIECLKINAKNNELEFEKVIKIQFDTLRNDKSNEIFNSILFLQPLTIAVQGMILNFELS